VIIHLDFETRSALDLKKVGTDNYVKHSSTKILMMAYAFDDGLVKLWEPHREPFPNDVLEAIKDPHIIKAAWHANFEKSLLFCKLDIDTAIESWIDPMVNARYFSLPGSLEDVGEILKLPINLRKSSEGEDLIKLFSVPRPVKKGRRQATNENTLFDISPTENAAQEYVFADHTTHPEEWEAFGGYCKQDVVAERAIGTWLNHKQCAPLPEREMKLWYLDQKINVFGMPADRKFVENSYALAVKDKEALAERQKKLTGLENPNSNSQMLKWAQERGYPYNSIRKEPVTVALSDTEIKLTKDCREVLTLRKQSAKTSYTKLAALVSALSEDDYLRNQFLFMGSARAARWSGRQVQLHNMARPIKAMEKEGALDIARNFIYTNDYDGLEKTFGSVIDVVTSCIRSAFVAPIGSRFNVCDLNAIENRVLGWISGETKILDVFRTLSPSGRKRCPYLTFACVMYNIPYDVLERAYYEKKDPEAKEKRQVAKPAVLGAGYRLSGGEWKINRYGDRVKTGLWGYAENMGIAISQELSNESVKQFRAEYKKVVYAWYEYEDAVLRCLSGQGPQEMCSNGPIDSTYGCQLQGRAREHLVWCDRRRRKDGSYVLRIHLPAGRCLHYVNAQIVEREMPSRDGGTYKKKSMAYEGINQENKKWELIYTHGGKLVENVVQSIARDVLAEGMLECDRIGLQICGHIHDEIITLSEDTDEAPGLMDLKSFMSTTPVWAPGLPLDADGYQDRYYHK
jgi:DNA polymerase bacteriophage-type